MNITPTQRQAAEEKIIRCYEVAENEFGVTLPRPEVVYKLKGVVAGRAFPRQLKIDINEGLFARNYDTFLETTVPHEAAHLIAFQVYQKRCGHGDDWRHVMRVLGVKNITRCHQYDVSETKIVKTHYKYACASGCSIKMHGKNHNKASIGHEYVCKRHRLPVKYVETVSPVSNNPTPTVWVPKGTGTKMDLCVELFDIYKDVLSRKQMIQKFVMNAGCTPAGASTYYYNCQKLKGMK